MTQVQVRTLCPEWLKIKAKDPGIAAATAHHGNCPNQCGWGSSECWVYRFVDLAELSELILKADSDLIVADAAPAVAASPAKRGRKAKAGAATAAAVVPLELEHAAPLEDLLDDDNLDELL
jgi:hypothetical protein